MADVAAVREWIQPMLEAINGPRASAVELGPVEKRPDGNFSLRVGTSQVIVGVNEEASDAMASDVTTVLLIAPVLRNVQPKPDLYKFVAEYGESFASLTVGSNEDGTVNVVLYHGLLANHLTQEQLELATLEVASRADALDNELAARFGGLTVAASR